MVFQNNWRLLVGFTVLSMFIAADITQGKGLFLDVDGKIKAMRKPAVKSIQSSDGDIIDCVGIYDQPAFDHPALKNHTIQMRPSFDLKQDAINDKNKSSTLKTPGQTWQKSGSCPKGTIPIRRVRKRDLLRFSNLERFGRKSPPIATNSSNKGQLYPDRTVVVNNNVTVSLGPRPDHSSAVLVATVVHYTGSKGFITLYNPEVSRWDEYSSGQFWLQSGSPQYVESVESGWIVNKKLYGDTRTRFFTYWTSDGYQKTGCFDLICSGFVQTSSEVSLGAAFDPISTPGGPIYGFTLQIAMDTPTGNWWLTIQNITIGYWPASLFTEILGQGATILQWGGDVYSANVRKTPHTTTAMGSGQYLGINPKDNCYIENIRVLQDPTRDWDYPNPHYVATYVDKNQCYGANFYMPGYMTEPRLFFGGPGQNSLCP
ncbi:hypothetical protein RND81_10G168000 [Saponaria officinalis]|uniref:Neprosin PEP catalytic domain-containing protein n=1 Tax=Saponaria officinalis TaxID=3572 RepID=A0AAW1I5H3_SAPOF